MAARPGLEERLVSVEQQVRALTQAMDTVVAELRTRKVLPDVPATPKRRRKVKMDPKTRAEQRRALLAKARENRWAATKPAKKGRKR